MWRKSILVPLILAAFSACSRPTPPSASWQPLFNGQDLSGWENVGDGNWFVRDGSIVVSREDGQPNKGWLVTQHEFGDFKLRLKFKSAHEKFNSGVLFRDPGHAKVGRPAFNGFELQLFQDDNPNERNTSGAIYDLAAAYPVKIEPDRWIDVEIECRGDHITAHLNGTKTSEIHIRRSYQGAIGFQLHGGTTPVELWWKDIEIMELPPGPVGGKLMEERLELAPGETVDFLAGKTLQDDFDTYWDGGAQWTLQDGVLRGEHPSEISWIFAKERHADFILAFDFRVSKGGNGGVCIRLPWPADGNTSAGPASLGYECQIMEPPELSPTGSIYGLARAYEQDPWHRTIHKSEKWNQYRIYASGDHIVTYVNRIKTAETHVDRSLAGRIGFQVHHPAEWIEYRNVQLKVVTKDAAPRQ